MTIALVCFVYLEQAAACSSVLLLLSAQLMSNLGMADISFLQQSSLPCRAATCTGNIPPLPGLSTCACHHIIILVTDVL